MTAIRTLSALGLLFFLFSCSALKVDSNCLNEKSGCFKADVTPPKLQQAVYPVSNQLVSVLSYTDLMFSEELNNPQPGDFIFSGPGQDLAVGAVTKLNDYTYRLSVIQRTLVSGPIYLDFTKLKDYNNNIIQGVTRVTYQGNIDIPITIPSVDSNDNPITNPTHLGVSSAGGSAYATLDISWYYNYTPPPTNPGVTVYSVKRTTGSLDCTGALDISGSIASPTPVAGVVTTYDATNAATRAATTHKFTLDTTTLPNLTPPAKHTILICVDNVVNNKHGKVAIELVRSNSAPAMTISQQPGGYASPKTIALGCSPYMDKIAYKSAQTTDGLTDPATLIGTQPGFTSGAISSGSLYDSNSPLQTGYSGDPTWSAFAYSCIDLAGNIATTPTKTIYKVDSRFPTVSLVSVTKSGTTTPVLGISQAGNYQNVDITFKTNQLQEKWEIRTDGLACGSVGSTAASGVAGPVTGTPATANAPFTKTIAYNSGTLGSGNGTYTMTLCVFSSTVNDWGQDTFTLVRDDGPPTITMNVAAGSFGAQQNVIPICSTNADKIMYTSATLAGGTAPVTPAAPVFDAPSGTFTTGTLFSGPLLTPDASTTTYVFVCLNKGGRLTSAPLTQTYKIDSILPNINVVSSSRDYLSNATGYTTTTLVWQSSRGGLSYFLKQPGTACNGSNLTGAANLTGTTPTDVSQTITSTVDVSNFSGDGAYNIQICVQNFVNQWGYVDYKLTKDTVTPVIAIANVLPSITPVDSLNYTLTWNAATDNNSVAFYRIFRRTAAGTYGSTPDYTSIGSPTTIALTDTQQYFFRIVPVDIAGNIPGSAPLVYSDVSNKAMITLIVSGLSGAFNLTDGASSQTISANTAGTAWTTSLVSGQPYQFNITLQPTGQVCAIRQQQFGTFSGNMTITVNCATGQITGGTYQQIPPAPLNYFLHRGNTTTEVARGAAGVSGSFISSGVAITGSGTAFVTDPGTSQIYRLAGSGVLVSVAGNGSTAGIADGLGAAATFSNPSYMASDGTNLYISQVGLAIGTSANDGIRKLDPAGNVTTLVNGSQALDPEGIVVVGNLLYWANRSSHEIKSYDLLTGAVAVVAGSTGVAGSANGTGTGATLNQPMGLTALNGRLYVTEFGSHRIRTINISTQAVSTLAGSSAGTIDGKIAVAKFNGPSGIATDGFDLYIVDYYSRSLRRIRLDRSGGANHIVSTIAGNGASGGANGVGLAATFTAPVALATNGRQFFVSDEGNGTVRKVVDLGAVGYWPNNFGNQQEYASGISSPLTGSLAGSISDTSTADRFNNAGGAQNLQGAEYVTASATSVTGTSCNTTLAAWYKPNSLATTQGIVYNGNSGNSGFGLVFDATTGIRGLLGGVGWVPASGSSFMPPINQWTHVVLRCTQGTRWALFINGHQLAETAMTPLSNPLGQIIIGRDSVSSYVNGSVTDVRLYNRPLNESEINELAQDASSNAAVTGPSFNKGATGLLSHYEMNGGSFTDSGSVNYPIVSSNGTATTGKDGDINGAYSFVAASNQFLATAANTVDGTGTLGEITVAAWVNPASLPAPSGIYLIASRYAASDATKGYYFEFFNSAGTQQLYWASSGGVSSYKTDISLPLNTWTHVAVTHSGTTATIYVNGQAMPTSQTTPCPLAPTSLSTPIYIGKRDDGQFTDGKIDDVRIYNNALSAWQIRQLATKVPMGLVSRYDFTGDRSDISGYGQDLSNNGVNLGTDRFGLTGAAVTFASNAYFDGSMNNFPIGNSARTICAWTNPTTLSPTTFSEAVMYGISTAGWGLGMDAGAPNSGRVFNLNGVADLIYYQPHGLGVWRHVCATHNGATQQLFLDAALVATQGTAGSPITLATGSGTLQIGRGVFGSSDYFTGSIDDVRIYNRVLNGSEIQALQQ